MGYQDELRAQERKDLNMMFLEEYETVQNDEYNRKLPKPIRVELENLFVLRHQFFHTGYINMYLHPERTTDVERFLRNSFIAIEGAARSFPKYKYALTLDTKTLEEKLNKIKELGQELADEMRKDVFVTNLERCSTLRIAVDDAIIDMFERMDKDWDTLYMPSQDLMEKEDQVAYDSRTSVSVPYESRSSRSRGSAANEMLSNKQLTQIKIDIGMIDREVKMSQAEFNARKKVRDRGLAPEVEDALVQLSLDRHQYHTSASTRTFVNPDKQSKVVDSIRASLEILAANTEATDEHKGCLPISFDFETLLNELKQIGRDAKMRDYQEPHFSQSVAKFCEKKDELDDAIRAYFEATDKEFGTRIAPKCTQRENVDALDVTTRNIRTVIEKEKEFEQKMQRNRYGRIK